MKHRKYLNLLTILCEFHRQVVYFSCLFALFTDNEGVLPLEVLPTLVTGLRGIGNMTCSGSRRLGSIHNLCLGYNYLSSAYHQVLLPSSSESVIQLLDFSDILSLEEKDLG